MRPTSSGVSPLYFQVVTQPDCHYKTSRVQLWTAKVLLSFGIYPMPLLGYAMYVNTLFSTEKKLIIQPRIQW